MREKKTRGRERQNDRAKQTEGGRGGCVCECMRVYVRACVHACGMRMGVRATMYILNKNVCMLLYTFSLHTFLLGTLRNKANVACHEPHTYATASWRTV